MVFQLSNKLYNFGLDDSLRFLASENLSSPYAKEVTNGIKAKQYEITYKYFNIQHSFPHLKGGKSWFPE
jgi:hypothetical protein